MQPDFVVRIGNTLIMGDRIAHLMPVLLQRDLMHMQCGFQDTGKDVVTIAIGCPGIGDGSAKI